MARGTVEAFIPQPENEWDVVDVADAQQVESLGSEWDVVGEQAAPGPHDAVVDQYYSGGLTPRKKEIVEELARRGLIDLKSGARSVVEGVTSLPLMVGDAANTLVNYGIEGINTLAGTDIPELDMPSEISRQMLDATGAQEDTGITGDIIRGAAGAMTFPAGAAASAPVSAAGTALKTAFAAKPIAQVVSGAGAGAGSGIVREAGGGPGAQMVGSLVGGMAPYAIKQTPAAFRSSVTGKRGPEGVAENIRTFGEANTVPTVGQATQGRAAQAAESFLSRSPGSAGVIADKAATQGDDIARMIEEIAGKSGGKAQTGKAIKEGVADFVARFKEKSGELYSLVDGVIPPSQKVPVNNTISTLRNLTSRIKGAAKTSEEFINPKLARIKQNIIQDTGETIRARRDSVKNTIQEINAVQSKLDDLERNIIDQSANRTARDVKAALIRDIRAAKKKFGDDAPIGVRTFDAEYGDFKSGDSLPNSYNWEDGNIILDDPILGTAAFRADERNINNALAYSVGGKNQKIGVVVGEGFSDHAMPEPGAVALRNAKLFSEYQRPDFGFSREMVGKKLRKIHVSINELTAKKKELADRLSSELPDMLKDDLAELAKGRQMPYQAMKELRTRIGYLLDSSEMMSDIPKSELKKLYGAISRDIEGGLPPEATSFLKRANTFYKAGKDRVDTLENVLSGKTYEKIYNAAIGETKDGPTLINKVLRSMPRQTRQKMAHEFLRTMGKSTAGKQNAAVDAFSTETFLTNWGKMDSKAKSALFSNISPDYVKAVNAIAKVAENIRTGSKVFSNPSGTQQAVSLQQTIGGAMVLLLTGNVGPAIATAAEPAIAYGAAKWMTNPNIVKWLAQNNRRPIERLPILINSLAKQHRNDAEVQDFVEALQGEE